MKLPTSAYVVSVPSAIHQIQKVPIESARLIHPHFISPVAVNQSVGTWPKKKKTEILHNEKKKPEQEKNLWKLNSVSWGGNWKSSDTFLSLELSKSLSIWRLANRIELTCLHYWQLIRNRMYRKNLYLYICTFKYMHLRLWPIRNLRPGLRMWKLLCQYIQSIICDCQQFKNCIVCLKKG